MALETFTPFCTNVASGKVVPVPMGRVSRAAERRECREPTRQRGPHPRRRPPEGTSAFAGACLPPGARIAPPVLIDDQAGRHIGRWLRSAHVNRVALGPGFFSRLARRRPRSVSRDGHGRPCDVLVDGPGLFLFVGVRPRHATEDGPSTVAGEDGSRSAWAVKECFTLAPRGRHSSRTSVRATRRPPRRSYGAPAS